MKSRNLKLALVVVAVGCVALAYRWCGADGRRPSSDDHSEVGKDLPNKRTRSTLGERSRSERRSARTSRRPRQFRVSRTAGDERRLAAKRLRRPDPNDPNHVPNYKKHDTYDRRAHEEKTRKAVESLVNKRLGTGLDPSKRQAVLRLAGALLKTDLDLRDKMKNGTYTAADKTERDATVKKLKAQLSSLLTADQYHKLVGDDDDSKSQHNH